MATALAERRQRVLHLARTHLGMDVAWLSRFTGGEQLIVQADGDLAGIGLEINCGTSYEDSYCARVLTGDLPSVIPRARHDPRTRDLPITARLGIGAYVGVPVSRPDGSAEGMLCCVSRSAQPRLDDRDARFLQLLARLLEESDDSALQAAAADEEQARDRSRTRMLRALAAREVQPVFQAIVRLHDLQVVGVEALSRFDRSLGTDPAQVFSDAGQLGLGPDLELVAIERALEQLADLPEGMRLGLNASPQALMDPRLTARLLDERGDRLCLEVTEHAPVRDYPTLVRTLDGLRAEGVKIAVDDAGAGFASLRHILQLRPDSIKLDLEITRGIAADPVRQALAQSLLGFARSLQAELLAEGVETGEDLQALRSLGVDLVQGYLFGRPGPLAQAVSTKESRR
ncbi:sensor domain-containing phosphodiesterase [Motilibacter aurantiacus]|uniref:sensor domain-containing phosphodiesterase n=1 Tax=Motilibacter aurantiacus TaxID=2714955 RepID=UPI002F2B3DD7